MISIENEWANDDGLENELIVRGLYDDNATDLITCRRSSVFACHDFRYWEYRNYIFFGQIAAASTLESLSAQTLFSSTLDC